MPTTSGSKKKSARASSSSVDSGSKSRSRQQQQSSERPELSNEANFPPFYPIIRHSLGDLLTPLKKACAIYAICIWAFNCFVLLLNFVATFFYLGMGGPEPIIMILVSFLFLILIPIPSVFTHYWPLYLACRSGNAIMYFLFGILWVVEIVFNVVMIIGVPYTGSCGLLTIIVLLFKALGDSTGIAWASVVIHLIVLLCWILNIVLVVIGIVLMYPNYKGDNGNLVEIQNQIISRVKALRAKAAFGGVQNVV